MAASLPERADRRAALVQAAIADALAGGDHHQALNLALRALQSESAKLRRRHRGDGALTDAQLAGSIAGIAASLHGHKPPRPPGCPRMPGPAELVRVFTASLTSAQDGETHE